MRIIALNDWLAVVTFKEIWMKVKDLIEQLRCRDGDSEVIIRACCDNCSWWMYELVGAELRDVFTEETPEGCAQNYREPKQNMNGVWTGEDDLDDAISAVVLY